MLIIIPVHYLVIEICNMITINLRTIQSGCQQLIVYLILWWSVLSQGVVHVEAVELDLLHVKTAIDENSEKISYVQRQQLQVLAIQIKARYTLCMFSCFHIFASFF